jgi:glucose/arabinose dehydrogenase
MPARIVIASAVALTALAAGCGGGGGSSTSAPSSSTVVQSQPSPSGSKVALQKIGDFDQPTYIAQPPGSNDLYVVEQGGTIRIVRDGQVLSDPALDISDQVTNNDEQGLLSIAFPPNFQSSHLAYAYFTGTDQDQHVVRYTVRPDGSFDEGSAREILKMADFAENHNGGQLQFGPDGDLYIGTGDGGQEEDPHRTGQDLGTLLGKLLRIKPATGAGGAPYAIPPDNPFVNRPPGARPEIYSYGLRNPWRYSFDAKTGALIIADVGQYSLEEVDYTLKGKARGANFGWSAFEGTDRFNQDQTAPNAVPPIFEYSHDGGACSITGGYIVRDRSLPSLYGRYVYGDYCTGDLSSLVPGIPHGKDDRSLGLNVPSVSSFGEDNQDHIYVASHDGSVYRIVPGG